MWSRLSVTQKCIKFILGEYLTRENFLTNIPHPLLILLDISRHSSFRLFVSLNNNNNYVLAHTVLIVQFPIRIQLTICIALYNNIKHASDRLFLTNTTSHGNSSQKKKLMKAQGRVGWDESQTTHLSLQQDINSTPFSPPPLISIVKIRRGFLLPFD